MFDVVLLIAGRGSRTHLSYNKMLHLVNGKALFLYPLETFLACDECEKIVLVAAKDQEHLIANLVSQYDSNRISIVVGGEVRQDSVAAGVKACANELVLIHDGARVLVSNTNIQKILEAMLQAKAAALGVKVTDTIREQKEQTVTLLNRSNLWAMQTPQAIYRSMYLHAYAEAKEDAFVATDDVALLERYFDIKPTIVEGSYENFKVTTKQDILVIESYLKGGMK